MTPELWVMPDESELARAGAEIFVRCARESVSKRGRFSVMLSGGNTPKKMLELLAGAEFLDQVSWKVTHVFWGDERLVPSDHPDSNFHMAWEALLQLTPIPPDQIHRVRTELAQAKGVAAVIDDYERQIRDFGSNFDLIYLGMGEDGHTASLFPGTSIPAEGGRLVLATKAPSQPVNRISISPQVISNARQVSVIVSGEKKARTLQSVLEGPFDPKRYPVQWVHSRDGETLWIVDERAASLLSQRLSA